MVIDTDVLSAGFADVEAIAEWCWDLFMNTATITSEALSLAVQERAELVAQLLSSLDALSESEIEPLGLQEVAPRVEAEDFRKLTTAYDCDLAA